MAEDKMEYLNDFPLVAEKYPKAKNNGWVKCSDRMPEEGIMVCVADADVGHIYGACCAYYSKGEFSVMPGLEASNYDGGALVDISLEPTHWQPLPSPPEE